MAQLGRDPGLLVRRKASLEAIGLGTGGGAELKVGRCLFCWN